MIINIRGTGGAGKSTLVREVMLRYPKRTPEYISERKQPIGYRCEQFGKSSLWVVGHYESPCGGGDTMPTPAAVFDSVRAAAQRGDDTIFEGIISQDDTLRSIQLSREYAVLVLALDVPIDVCLASIQGRRDARGDVRPLNPTNTVNRARRLVGTMRKLVTAGVDARWVSRDEALLTIIAALGLGGDYDHSANQVEFELR